MSDNPVAPSVRVGALQYVVSYDSDLVHQGLDGKIMHCEGFIRLRPGMSPQHERIILWHEMLHAILHNAAMEPDDEERLIRVLAHGIAEVIADNPELGKP